MDKRTKERIGLGFTTGSLLALLYILCMVLAYKRVLVTEPNRWLLIAEIVAVAYATYYNIRKLLKD